MKKSRRISCYFNGEEIIAISTGKSKKYHLADIQVYERKKFPMSDEEVTELIRKAFENCDSKKYDDNDESSVIESITGIRGYINVMRKYKLFSMRWFKNDGYYISATEQKGRNGYIHIEEEPLGENPTDLEIAEKVKWAMSVCRQKYNHTVKLKSFMMWEFSLMICDIAKRQNGGKYVKSE